MKIFYRIPIDILVGVPIMLSILSLVAIPVLIQYIQIGNTVFILLFSGSLFFLGLSGIPIIITRKTPSYFMNLFGISETFTGVSISIIGFSSSIFFIVCAILV